ncbi:MAG: phage terminase large subunit [Clostridia bacterium]|nr:phage terminase large subunit [Clostridia bacterium]
MSNTIRRSRQSITKGSIIWQPQPRQAEFMSRPEYEVLYGGAAGGGKSDAIIAEALRQVDNPNYRAIIFRKTYPQCRELIIKSLRIYKAACPGAEYNGSEHYWRFPSGAKIYFGSMPNSTSYLAYQGLSYAYIAFDELTHFSIEEYEYMISRNRADGAGLRVYIRATANPGGIGHGWVKERFITASEPGVPYTVKSEVIDKSGKKITVSRDRVFIPSSIFDNKALLENDPGYLANLAMLPESQKKALLYGDWDSYEGQVFTEFRNDPSGYLSRRYSHVIEPFPIPRSWRRYRSFDFGYSRPFAVQWWAVDHDGRAYLYRQLYGSNGSPNVGVRTEPRELARRIRRIEDELETGNTIYGIADPSIWDESRGRDGTIISLFEAEGVFFEKGKNDRLSGKMQCHYRFAFDDEGLPMAYIFKTCKPFLRTIPNLVYDEVNVEDVNTAQEDHDYDAMRYFFMANPLPPRIAAAAKPKPFDPLG